MRSISITSLSEYLKAIECLQSYYPSNPIQNNPVSNPFLYRGMSKRTYKLIPSVFREKTTTENGLELSNQIYLSRADEKSLLMSFIHEASGIVSFPPNDLPHWAEYAQHYGVPTRFLDWTSNPLTAMYFACRDRTDEEGAVWMLHGSNYRRFIEQNNSMPDNKTTSELVNDLLHGKSSVEYPLLYTPYYVDSRMSAQGSYFMVWGTRIIPFEEMFVDESLWLELPEKECLARSYGWEQEVALLFCFHISSDSKQPILRELDMVGINEKTLFPGLDGVGRYIERKYRFDYNEFVHNT